MRDEIPKEAIELDKLLVELFDTKLNMVLSLFSLSILSLEEKLFSLFDFIPLFLLKIFKFFSFFFKSDFVFVPNESSFLFTDWSFLQILLSNIWSLNASSELS